jgi:AcrR family transcriptional regulator
MSKTQEPSEAIALRDQRAQKPESSARGMKRRAELIDTAIRLYSNRPYAEVSIDELAAEAGVAKGLLYYYFRDKRGLYVAALQHLAGELLDQLNETAAETSAEPLERLKRGLDAHLSFLERYTSGYRELMSSIGLYPELREIVEEGQQITVDMIMANIPPEVPHGPALELAVQGWGGFVDRVELAWLAGSKASREQVLELCTRTIVGAIMAAIEVDKTPRGAATAAEGATERETARDAQLAEVEAAGGKAKSEPGKAPQRRRGARRKASAGA